MRTSSRLGPLIRRLLIVAVFVALAVALNNVLTLVFVPYGSKSEIVWTDYSAADDIDCVVVGTSTSMAGFDPAVFDEELGCECFNLATPSQLLEESYLAVRTAYEDHGITRVILGLSHAQVMRSSDVNPGSAFMYQRSRAVNASQRLEGISYMLLDRGGIATPKSLNMAFPWVSNKVSDSVGAIVRNARMKLDGTSLYEGAEVSEPGWHYKGKGFGGYTNKLNYNGSKAMSYFVEDNPEDQGVEVGRTDVIDEGRAQALDDLCTYCADHGIELYAVVPPLPSYSVIEYGEDYLVLGDKLQSFIEERGGHYFDMNLARPELATFEEDYFADYTHLNFDGVKELSGATCKLIERVEADEDTRDLFMDTWEEYLAAVPGISCVLVDTEGVPEGAHLTARVMAGSNVEVECRFLVRKGDEWHELRGWNADPEFTYVPEGGKHGSVRLRVEARDARTGGKAARFRELTAMY